MENSHIVYAAFDKDGVCLYVGEGNEERWKHITSGTSHVYEANKWHFLGRKVEVKILKENLSKKEAVKLEKEKIIELNPAWNKREKTSSLKMTAHALKLYKQYLTTCSKRGNITRDTQLIKDLCDTLNNYGEVILLRGQKWYSVDVPAGFMSHLATEGTKYYAGIKSAFNITKSEGATNYHVELIGWKEDLA